MCIDRLYWVALLVYCYLCNTASFGLCAVCRFKDHHMLLHYSPRLKNTCVRQVVLDKWFPLGYAQSANSESATRPSFVESHVCVVCLFSSFVSCLSLLMYVCIVICLCVFCRIACWSEGSEHLQSSYCGITLWSAQGVMLRRKLIKPPNPMLSQTYFAHVGNTCP